jgi:ribonuclease HI
MNQPALPFDGDDDQRGVDDVTVYSDGGARGNPGPAAIGAVVLDTSSESPRPLASVSEAIGIATNNVAEYRALIAGLEAALPFRPRHLHVRADSLLVVNQLLGRWKVKHAGLRPLFEQARELLRRFEDVDLAHVRRGLNADADALVNAALDAPSAP